MARTPLAALAAGLLALAAPANAFTLYSNYDPLATAPLDYQTSVSSSLSGSCNSGFCSWINVFSVGFTFTPTASGEAGRAYIPFALISKVPGAENIYGLTISNADGQIVARGGITQSQIPANTIAGTNTVFFDLFPNNTAGQPVGGGIMAPNAPLLELGETYTAYFEQSYGSMSQNAWYASNEVPATGQATLYCRRNIGGACAYFDFGVNNWVGIPDAPITNFLPAIAITDANGFTVQDQPPISTPEPASLALLGLALAGLAAARRRA